MNLADWVASANTWSLAWESGLSRACLQGGIAFLVVWAVCRVFTKLPPALRPWLWRLAYLKLLAALFFTTAIDLPLLHSSPAPQAAPIAVASTAPPVNATPAQNPVAAQTGPNMPSASPVATASAPATSPAAAPVTLRAGAWLMLLWAVGAIWLLMRLAGEWCAAEWLRRLAEPLRDESVTTLYASLCRTFGLARPPKLRQAEGAGSPVLLGVTSLTIVLPAALLTECGPEELRLVLAHELAHRKRYDLLWGWLPALAHCLVFFFPLEWLAAREYRLTQEIACDALAVAMTDATVGAYGETLVKVATQRRPNLQSRLVTVGILESPESLKRRLIAMKNRETRVRAELALAAFALLTVGALGLLPWRLTARAAGKSAAEIKPPEPLGRGAVGKLRYGWKAGENYVYAVKIDSEEPDYDETLQGNATYTVRSADADGATLTCRGTLFPMRRTHEGRIVPGSGLLRLHMFGFGGFGRMGGPFGNPNEIKIDATGHLLSSRGGTALPRALGDLTSLVIETLGDGAAWETNATCNIALETTTPLSPFSHFGRTETRDLPAGEHTAYTLGASIGPLVEIDKHYELRTNEKNGEVPVLEMVGDGQIMFDAVAGVPKSMKFKVTLTDHLKRNTTVETPVTVTYRLLEGAEREQALHPPPPPKVELKPLTDPERAQVLTDLTASDNSKKMGAANKLAQAAPDSHRAEINRALEALLTDKDGFTRASAVKALGVWGDAKSVPPLIGRLDDEAFNVRWAALEALGALKDARAAEPIAKCLKKDHDFASRALQALGPPAAPAVVPYLKDEDWAVRLDACHILKAIGAKSSVSALEAASHDSNGLVAGAAQEALKAIAAR